MLLSQWLSWELHGSHTRWNCETREAAALASGRLTESHSEEANVVGGPGGSDVLGVPGGNCFSIRRPSL